MALEMKPITSSNISQVGYDAESKTLAVQFANGSTYHYTNVPPETWQAAQESDSFGKFFHSDIRGKFDSSKQ